MLACDFCRQAAGIMPNLANICHSCAQGMRRNRTNQLNLMRNEPEVEMGGIRRHRYSSKCFLGLTGPSHCSPCSFENKTGLQTVIVPVGAQLIKKIEKKTFSELYIPVAHAPQPAASGHAWEPPCLKMLLSSGVASKSTRYDAAALAKRDQLQVDNQALVIPTNQACNIEKHDETCITALSFKQTEVLESVHTCYEFVKFKKQESLLISNLVLEDTLRIFGTESLGRSLAMVDQHRPMQLANLKRTTAANRF